ncbi:MAG: hypothetical protein KTR35_07210 [Gammaproteobacteria bacterium]|nr:hypothetical protein [Gammaproteobacteria bacterium]
MRGPEDQYSVGEATAKTIYAPLDPSHRVTVNQMEPPEPGLSETGCAWLLTVMREAMEKVVARGVEKKVKLNFEHGKQTGPAF